MAILRYNAQQFHPAGWGKLDNQVARDLDISDGAFRVYAFYLGMNPGADITDKYIVKALGISQPVLTKRKNELKKKDLIVMDRVGSKEYIIYVGNYNYSASYVKAHWRNEQ